MPVPNQDNAAVAEKAAEYERRSAGVRKAWITIRRNKAAAKDATQATPLVTPTDKPSEAFVATDPVHPNEQMPSEFSALSLDNAGTLFQNRVGKAEIKTIEAQRIPYPAVGSESKANSKRKPPGVPAKEGGTPLKRGRALQVMAYPRPETKAVLVRAAQQHDQALSSFLILAGLEKAASLKGCEVKDLVPPDELQQYV